MNRQRAAHLALLVAGLAVALYGLWGLSNLQVTCRGVEMGPGDVCHKNDFSVMGTEEVQSYEDRLRALRLSQPVVIGTGLVVAGFATVLLRGERTREDAPTLAGRGARAQVG
ncbi:hypothetical protein [Luteococcus sp.]|uniref:hypothetical protein n=1 Tax=Luteococcus sp. TaxID=1969402 RepID=UPI003735C089